MRYNGIIILRITDFRDYFSFDEFWKNRKLFPAVSRNQRFCWKLDKDTLDSCLIQIVNEWLEGIQSSFFMKDSIFYSLFGKVLCPVDKEVYKFLASHLDPILRNEENMMGLCALYQLFNEKERKQYLKEDITTINTLLTLDSLDYSKPLVEFEEGGKAFSVGVKVCSEDFGFPIHLVWIKNKSSRHKVKLRRRMEDDTFGETIRELKPKECVLAVFNSENAWIKELPCSYVSPTCSIELKSREDGSPERYLQLRFKNKKVIPSFDSVVSFCSDDDGYVFVTDDLYKPIQCCHPYYDSDTIRKSLANEHLKEDEVVLYTEMQHDSLSIFTNYRNLFLSGDRVK